MQTGNAVVAELRAMAESSGEVIAPLRRLTEPAYGDGVAAPRPSPADAEEVAFTVFTQGGADMPSPLGLSALWIFWGQFLDHDMDLSPEQEGPEAEFMKWEGEAAPFNVRRSETWAGTGEDGVPAEQMNSVTPLIDGSNVYGSDTARMTMLRTGEGGRMITQPGPEGLALLPDAAMLDPGSGETRFVAGDIRADENAALTALHTIWVNEHNHWADRLAARHPGWSDEELFQSARAIVGTLLQKITYEEFLPKLIGDALPAHDGFDPGVDPQVSNEFATAAYRFGHTAIPETLVFLAEDGTAPRPALPLFEAFEDDTVLREAGAPALLRGLLAQPSQAIDASVVDSLNLLLFTPDGGLTGFSLPERNILRGRDHGIDSWAEVREQLLGDVDAAALAGLEDFSVITPDPALQAALAAVYPTVGEVDLWVGGLAEPPAPGAALGPLFTAILAEQFAATRDGDPLFYTIRDWTDEDLAAEVKATGFADVLMRSAGIAHVQADPFLASDRQGGGPGADHLAGSAARDLLIGAAGDDLLEGGAAADDLFGGAGADLFRGTLQDLAGDRIADFGTKDRIAVLGTPAEDLTVETAASGADTRLTLGDGTGLSVTLTLAGTFEQVRVTGESARDALLTLRRVPEAADGVIRGTDRDDALLVGQNAIYLGGAGADIFVVSRAAVGDGVSVIDGASGDTIQFVEGLEVLSSLLLPDALQLDLANGARVQILGADGLAFETGGNVTTGETGAISDYAAFARDVLGAEVPGDGMAEGGAVTLTADAVLL